NSTAGSNCGGTISDGGHNIDEDTSCVFTGTGCTNTSGTSFCNTNPLLDPAGLARNGGPTQTIALEAGSRAINAGDETVCAAPPVNNLDQRGFVRPGMGATNCSIGAYEFDAVLAPCGTFLTAWGLPGSGDGEFNNPYGIAVDASGDVFVADTLNNRIQKFTGAGTFLTKWGMSGSGDGEFNAPFGIGVEASGDSFVADNVNSRIQKFTGAGMFLTKWGIPGSGDGEFVAPRGVAVDASGNIFAVDNGNSRIQKFTGTGTLLTKWGMDGTGDGQFKSPFGVAVDVHGNVLVADTLNTRIQKCVCPGMMVCSTTTTT